MPRFEVDLKHMMEDIQEQSSIPIEEATIVENMDNFLDDRYSEIHLNSDLEKLRILMIGSGMSKEVFEKKLSTIAGTTKVAEGRKALGRYGYGMKIMLPVSEHVLIETKLSDYHEALQWKMIDGEPYWDKISPREKRENDFTLIEIQLKEEYQEKFSSEFIKRVLQHYYPTVLGGAPVINQYGEKRKVKIFVGHEQVNPPELECERKRLISFKLDRGEVSGYVFLTKKEVKEDERGIAIIVHGRKITRENFNVYGSGNINARITGYIHADVLIDDLAVDKTKIKKHSSRWKKVNEECGKMLSQFLREIGAAREERLPKKLMKQVHEELNKLIKEFPELQKIAVSPRQEEVLIKKKGGDISTELSTKGQWVPGPGPSKGPGKESVAPANLGDEDVKAPSDNPGRHETIKKKRKTKRGIEIKQTPLEEKIESVFNPDGTVVVNTKFPTYKKAEKEKSLAYHVMRVAIDSIMDYMSESGIISTEKGKSYRNEVLMEWGKL